MCKEITLTLDDAPTQKSSLEYSRLAAIAIFSGPAPSRDIVRLKGFDDARPVAAVPVAADVLGGRRRHQPRRRPRSRALPTV